MSVVNCDKLTLKPFKSVHSFNVDMLHLVLFLPLFTHLIIMFNSFSLLLYISYMYAIARGSSRKNLLQWNRSFPIYIERTNLDILKNVLSHHCGS